MMRRRFWVRSASPRLAEGSTTPWTIKGLIGNYAGYMGQISVFHSILEAGQMPHAIESHDAEELLLTVSGELNVLTAESIRRVGPGGFVHIPSGARHTIRSAGPDSAFFLVFKWTCQNAARASLAATPFVLEGHGFDRVTNQSGIYRRRVCENQPLANGGRLAVETIRLAPQTGFPAHTHDHDLMLVLLGGQMHALGHVTSAPAIIYYPAGTAHGLQPLNPDPIEMIAFEFHQQSAGVL